MGSCRQAASCAANRLSALSEAAARVAKMGLAFHGRVLGDFDFCYYIGFAISAKAFIRFLLLGWLDGLGVVVGWYTYG